MDSFDPGIEHDWPRSDPYDGLGEAEYHRRLHASEAERVQAEGDARRARRYTVDEALVQLQAECFPSSQLEMVRPELETMAAERGITGADLEDYRWKML